MSLIYVGHILVAGVARKSKLSASPLAPADSASACLMSSSRGAGVHQSCPLCNANSWVSPCSRPIPLVPRLPFWRGSCSRGCRPWCLMPAWGRRELRIRGLGRKAREGPRCPVCQQKSQQPAEQTPSWQQLPPCRTNNAVRLPMWQCALPVTGPLQEELQGMADWQEEQQVQDYLSRKQLRLPVASACPLAIWMCGGRRRMP